jgi:hypothetical protein
MINFKLCYQIQNSDLYISPQLLPKNQPEYNWNSSNNIKLRYTFDFMPKGILSQFIVSMHKNIYNQEFVWREGVLLEYNNTRAEVIEYYSKREITIRTEGRDKRDFMTIISYEIDKIIESYKRLKSNKLIPCNCNNCSKSNNPHYFKLSDLKRRISNRRYDIECEQSYLKINILGLIDDIFMRSIIQDEIEKSKNVEIMKSKTKISNEVFISYAWGGESGSVVDDLEKLLKDNELNVLRDIDQINYKDNINSFMKRLGIGKYIIVILSKKYLESPNCMYELVQISKNGHFSDRIFPIVLPDANIYDPINRIEYIQYWERKINELDVAIKTVSSSYLKGIREEIDFYSDIRKLISEILDVIKNMNTSNLELLKNEKYKTVINTIKNKMEIDNK